MAPAMPADSSKTLQLSQRNDRPEPATITRNGSPSQQRESTVGEDYVTQGKFRYTIVLTRSQISYQQ